MKNTMVFNTLKTHCQSQGVIVSDTWFMRLYKRLVALLKVSDPAHLVVHAGEILLGDNGGLTTLVFVFKNTASNKVVMVGYTYAGISEPTMVILTEVQSGASMFGDTFKTYFQHGIVWVWTYTLKGNKITLKEINTIKGDGDRSRSPITSYAPVTVRDETAEVFSRPHLHKWIIRKDDRSVIAQVLLQVPAPTTYTVDFGVV